MNDMPRDPITKRYIVLFPDFNHDQIVGLVNPPETVSVSLRSLDDPALELEIDTIRGIVADGNKYGRHLGSSNHEQPKERHAIVHQVRENQYVFFVVFGTAKHVAKFLNIRFRIPKKYKSKTLPYILGWKLIDDDPIRDADPSLVPVKIVF